MPTSYYAGDSGIGITIRLCCEGRARNMGVIGLGAGTMAAYGRQEIGSGFTRSTPLWNRLRKMSLRIFAILAPNS